MKAGYKFAMWLCIGFLLGYVIDMAISMTWIQALIIGVIIGILGSKDDRDQSKER